jgi:hypothetical protein
LCSGCNQDAIRRTWLEELIGDRPLTNATNPGEPSAFGVFSFQSTEKQTSSVLRKHAR